MRPAWLWEFCAWLGAASLLCVVAVLLCCVASYVWVERIRPRIARRRETRRAIDDVIADSRDLARAWARWGHP